MKWASWGSLALPIVAYVLCSEVSTGQLYLSQPPHGRSVVLLRYFAFLVSALIAAVVLLVDLRLKRWRLAWLPLSSMLVTYCLWAEATVFARFLDGA